MVFEERRIEADGLSTRYLIAGEGPPMVLLHGAGDNALDWWWVMPALAATHQVYAPDLPGSPDSARPTADYSPAFFERFVASFVDALDIGRATFVGNSLGGFIALRLALSDPARVTALVLVDSAGLGRAVNPAFTSVNVPGLGEAAIPFWRTPVGAHQRAWGRTALLLAHPPRGIPLGLIPGMGYEEKERTLAPGDGVLFYSDGLIEAHSPRREMFSTPRMERFVGAHPSSATLIDALLAELEQFTGEQWEQEDDITLLMLQRFRSSY
jgi:pimeloyl-ACP methyl ester carboxylesterase